MNKLERNNHQELPNDSLMDHQQHLNGDDQLLPDEDDDNEMEDQEEEHQPFAGQENLQTGLNQSHISPSKQQSPTPRHPHAKHHNRRSRDQHGISSTPSPVPARPNGTGTSTGSTEDSEQNRCYSRLTPSSENSYNSSLYNNVINNKLLSSSQPCQQDSSNNCPPLNNNPAVGNLPTFSVKRENEGRENSVNKSGTVSLLQNNEKTRGLVPTVPSSSEIIGTLPLPPIRKRLNIDVELRHKRAQREARQRAEELQEELEQEQEEEELKKKVSNPILRLVYKLANKQSEEKKRELTLDMLQPTRYRPDDLEHMVEETKFSKREVRRFYRAFKQQCPNGIIDEETFKEVYEKIFPLGDATAYAQLVFSAIDRDRTGGITFGDFMEFLSITSKGSLQDKLLWAFTFYDVDNDGVISKEEMLKVTDSIHELMGSFTATATNDAHNQVNQIFENMDLNRDGLISVDEFLEYCTTNQGVRESLQVFLQQPVNTMIH